MEKNVGIAEEIRATKQMAQAGTRAELVPTPTPRDAHRIHEEWHRVQEARGCSAIPLCPSPGPRHFAVRAALAALL